MHDTIRLDAVTPVSLRLKEARAATGFSTRMVEAMLRRRFPGLSVSHASIANFEKGATSPNIEIIGALALVYDRPINWFLCPGPALTGVRYRLLSSRTGTKERHKFESQSAHILEAYIRLERRIGKPLKPSISRSIVGSSMSAEEAAKAVRIQLKLRDTDSVYSVIEVLEKFGIRVVEMATELNIDGFAARFGGEPVVVLNPSTANDRCRINAAHECAHVLFGDCDTTSNTTRAMDDKAFEFASHLLIPRSQLKKAFEGRSAVQLVQYKERFGISMAAMIFRAEKLGILSERVTRFLWIQFSRRGWRAKEPGRVRADRAFRFERLLDRAISEKKLSWSEASDVTGVTSETLTRRRDMAMGIVGDEEGGDVLPIR